jgi:hypothetical protein
VLTLILMGVLGLAVVAMIEALTAPLHPRARWAVTVAAVIALPAWFSGAGGWGHLEDAMVYATIIGALLALRGQRALLLGVLLGVAVAAKPWAVIFVPLLLVLQDRQRKLLAALTALVVFAAFWFPFLIAAPQTAQLASLPRLLSPLSSWHVLGLHSGQIVPGWVRPVQMLGGLGLVAVLARRDVFLAVFVGFVWRVAADPETFMYYGVGPAVGAMLLDARRGGLPVWTAATVASLYSYYVLPDVAVWTRFLLPLGVGLVAAGLLRPGLILNARKPPYPEAVGYGGST